MISNNAFFYTKHLIAFSICNKTAGNNQQVTIMSFSLILIKIKDTLRKQKIGEISKNISQIPIRPFKDNRSELFDTGSFHYST
jgi:hypothetical protein